MINIILGKKQAQSQKFLEDGTRIPVTEVYVPGNPVISIKNKDKNGYRAIQLGFGMRKKPTKAILGQQKGAKINYAPLYYREARIYEKDTENLPNLGDQIKASDVFKAGDIVDVIGLSKGKGYAGVVKRHHFKGGPRTHGQSDRERAPGSIGQTTTPGRVYKGKRMSGKMGNENVTVKNLKIVEVLEDKVLIKGLVPGALNSMVVVRKVGESKKFIPLYKTEEAKNPSIEETKNAEETKEVKENGK